MMRQFWFPTPGGDRGPGGGDSHHRQFYPGHHRWDVCRGTVTPAAIRLVGILLLFLSPSPCLSRVGNLIDFAVVGSEIFVALFPVETFVAVVSSTLCLPIPPLEIVHNHLHGTLDFPLDTEKLII